MTWCIRISLLAILLLFSGTSGCKRQALVEKLDPEAERELAEFDRRMAIRQEELESFQSGSGSAASPAPQVTGIPGTTESGSPPAPMASEPERVVREFLDLLRKGERFPAQRHLTAEAREQSARAGLELDAPGGKDTTYSLMATRYATRAQQMAEVECLFHAPDYQGDSVKISWLLRKEPEGWKIYGMSVHTVEGTLELVSFENLEHLRRICPGPALPDAQSPVAREASVEENDLRYR